MRARYVTRGRLEVLRQDLGFRDWEILRTVEGLRLVSGKQLQRVHFPGQERQARRCLSRLTALGLLSRLDRRVGGVRAGSAGYVYALTRGGHRLVTGDSSTAKATHAPWTPGQPFLQHGLLVAETYVRLTEAAEAGQVVMLSWTGEPGCWRRFIGPSGAVAVVKPDVLVRIRLEGFEDSWFIEVDRGSESPNTLGRKFDVYRQYWATGREQVNVGVFPRVLWLAPTEARREQLVEVAARQPAEAWQLHTVRRFDELVEVIREGAA